MARRPTIITHTPWLEELPSPGLTPEEICMRREHGNDPPVVGCSWRPLTGVVASMVGHPRKKHKNLDQYDDSPDAW